MKATVRVEVSAWMRGSENTRSPAGVQVPDAVGFASAPDRSPADRNVGGAMSEVVVPDASRVSPSSMKSCAFSLDDESSEYD